MAGLLFIAMGFTVAMATNSAIQCINACWSFQNPMNLATVLECMADPPLVDTMCIISCDSRDRNFAFESICKSCEKDPPPSERLCTIACEAENLDKFRKICDMCKYEFGKQYQ